MYIVHRRSKNLRAFSRLCINNNLSNRL